MTSKRRLTRLEGRLRPGTCPACRDIKNVLVDAADAAGGPPETATAAERRHCAQCGRPFAVIRIEEVIVTTPEEARPVV
jgi:transcriptional regulator NrdR family protein